MTADRAALRHVGVQWIDGSTCRLNDTYQEMVLEVVPHRKVDDHVDVVVTQVLRRANSGDHQQSG